MTTSAMSEIEKAARAAVESWKKDGQNYDLFCERMKQLSAALDKQAEPVQVQAEPVQGLLRDALEHLRHLPWESETSTQKRGETFQGHMDRMSDVEERNNVRRDLISAIEATLAQQAEPVQVTYAMVEAAEAAHDAARGLQGGFWRSAVPAMIKAALAAKRQPEPETDPEAGNPSY